MRGRGGCGWLGGGSGGGCGSEVEGREEEGGAAANIEDCASDVVLCRLRPPDVIETGATPGQYDDCHELHTIEGYRVHAKDRIVELAGRSDWLVLDTETAGLDDEVISVAVVATTCERPFHSLVRPTAPIHPKATAVNVMTNEMYTARLGWPVDPERHVTVTVGVSEGIAAAMLATLNPGDEIIILEPAHDNFRPAALLAGAVPVAVPLEPPDYRFDPKRLRAAVTPRTRALLLNTPHNPSGRVFNSKELDIITDLVLQHDLLLLTDEIYDQIWYDGRGHVSPGSRPELRGKRLR